MRPFDGAPRRGRSIFPVSSTRACAYLGSALRWVPKPTSNATNSERLECANVVFSALSLGSGGNIRGSPRQNQREKRQQQKLVTSLAFSVARNRQIESAVGGVRISLFLSRFFSWWFSVLPGIICFFRSLAVPGSFLAVLASILVVSFLLFLTSVTSGQGVPTIFSVWSHDGVDFDFDEGLRPSGKCT